MKKYLIFILILSNITVGRAQSDMNKNLSLIYAYLYGKETEKAKQLINSKFLNSADNSYKILGYVYLAECYDKDIEQRVKALENAKSIAITAKDPTDMAYVDFGYASYYLKLKKYPLFLKHVNQSIDILNKSKSENFILSRLYYYKLQHKASNLSESDMISEAKNFNDFATASKDNLVIVNSYHSLAYSYYRMYISSDNEKYVDSISIAYSLASKHISTISEETARKKATIYHYLHTNFENLSSTDFDRELKDYHKALALSEDDQRFDEFTAQLYNNIGSIYQSTQMFSQAEDYFLKGYNLSKGNEAVMTANKLVIMNNLSKLYEKLQKPEKSLIYEREAKELIIDEQKKEFDENTKALEIFYNTEQKNEKIKQLEEKNAFYRKQKFLYWTVITLSLLAATFLSFLLISRQKLNNQKTKLLENDKKQTMLNLLLEQKENERLLAEQELIAMQQEQLQKKVLVTSLQLDNNKKFIEELKDNLKNGQPINLNKFLKEATTSDNKMEDIKEILQEVHPLFFKRLNQISKIKLTPLDLKYAAYTYLNMENQQIASILKVDPNTVKTTKYRLKQKLALGKEDDLRTFLQYLGS